MKTVGIVLLLLIPFVFAITIPQPSEVPVPPAPSFDTRTHSETGSQPKTTTQPAAQPSLSAGSQNSGSPIPSAIPEVEYPQQVQSNGELRSRVSALENEVTIVKSDLSALKASQGQVESETSYWQIVAIAGILVVISLVVKEGLVLLRRKHARETEVESYIRQARGAGVSNDEIVRRLAEAGWDEARIRQSMGR